MTEHCDDCDPSFGCWDLETHETCRKEPRQQWAMYHFEHGWLVDTCAGGTWRHDVAQAVEFSSPEEVTKAAFAAEIFDPLTLVLRTR